MDDGWYHGISNACFNGRDSLLKQFQRPSSLGGHQLETHNSFYSNHSMWVGVAVGGAYIKCGNGRRMHVPAHVLCAQTEIRMAESEAASIVEATTESQDSQNTIEYSLQGTNGSLSGDTADHPENILAKKTHEADSPEGKTVSPGIKNPPEQMNTGENQGGQVEDGEGNNNLKDEKSKTDTQGQVSELVKKDSRDESQEDSNNQGKSENSALTEIVNKRESDDPTNQTSEGGSDPVPGLVKSEENSIPDTELGRNESQDQSSTSEKTDNQDSQEDSKEAMEQDEGENDEMEVDEETGQVAGAGSEPEHSAEGMDEEKFSSDSSDDDSYWGRPWASRDTQLYRAGYPVSQRPIFYRMCMVFCINL